VSQAGPLLRVIAAHYATSCPLTRVQFHEARVPVQRDLRIIDSGVYSCTAYPAFRPAEELP